MSALSPLTINQQLVLDAVMNDPGITVPEIAEETELSDGRVLQALTRLLARELVLALGDEDVRYVTKAAS